MPPTWQSACCHFHFYLEGLLCLLSGLVWKRYWKNPFVSIRLFFILCSADSLGGHSEYLLAQPSLVFLNHVKYHMPSDSLGFAILPVSGSSHFACFWICHMRVEDSIPWQIPWHIPRHFLYSASACIIYFILMYYNNNTNIPHTKISKFSHPSPMWLYLTCWPQWPPRN